MRYLITGSTGLIGSQLLKILPEESVCTFCRGVDISKPIPTYEYPKNIDTIIHLANPRNFKDFPNSANVVFGVNVAATLSLLEYARKTGVKTFVLASTGGMGHVCNFYSTTKLCAELIAANYRGYMNIVTLPFYFVYGPGQDQTRLMPRLIDCVKNKKPIRLAGWSGIRINPIYVTDAVEAIVTALDKPSGRFDISGNEILSIREIAEIIGELVGKEPLFEETPISGNDIIGHMDIYTPKVSFREGISRMLI